jgi:fructokinase
VETVAPALNNVSVFFLDRLSRATLTLAKQAAEQGAVVVFEPSGKGSDKLFAEAIRLAHIIKYAHQRLASVDGIMQKGSTTLLEVQTLGDEGLRYRHRLGRGVSDWLHLNAVTAPRLADTCGSGDWCTAGLIAKATSGGLAGLREGGAKRIRTALRYGQALAAWNCGFEGARGGMYAVTRETFHEQLSALLTGQLDKVTDTVIDTGSESLVDCPACPPKPKPRPASRSKRAAA